MLSRPWLDTWTSSQEPRESAGRPVMLKGNCRVRGATLVLAAEPLVLGEMLVQYALRGK